MNGSEDIVSTFTFEEFVDRIVRAEDPYTISLLESVLVDEKKCYSIFHLKILVYALGLAKEHLIKTCF